jgi:creatinine amidohydrolase/Fe(II)-dependent formamide hydrolase-like protein
VSQRSRAPAPGGDPLSPLHVFDRLEVGPVVLEPERLVAPYRLQAAGSTAETELVYRFTEEVFAPREMASRNLASLLAAQVALNYGLFCEEIVLHGPFDRHDRRFLLDMARNTAREIYVKKFLQPNPFLRGSAASLPAVRRDSYLRARLLFPEAAELADEPWPLSAERHAVLSSGGKDSLLTYGLVREAGREVHPIFINESGRHWYTALNAYRHFDRHVPYTARVWTSADRVFAWMLRHLPFVRQDFARVRSDEYPVRLWTVAVFLFGALPLLRKRAIGRLLIGDEYDTTVRTSHEGITHYDGLYDQSRYFDEALTRFFLRKGWGIRQFSILRPLSELLIEKVLAERYPDLLRQQVSCHAAHQEQGRVHPCGHCEKCRRIVAMLTALGADPAACGYSPAQITRCLADLPAQELHQERANAEHVAHLLQERGRLPEGRLGGAPARFRPEILQLRFDRERSPVETIPRDLRAPLLRILLEHAAGAVKRSGRVWLPIDPLQQEFLSRPYPFETTLPGTKTATAPWTGAPPPGAVSAEQKPHDYLLGELAWPEARRRFREVDVALLPVGSIEQHGPHLPLDTDAFDADYLARRVAEQCSQPRPLVLPLVNYGVAYHHEDFAGTLSISPDTLSRLVYEIGTAAARHGITKLVIINAHGGNAPALHFAAQMINRDAHIFTCVDSGESSDADIAALVETPNDAHAGEFETSTSLVTRPWLVRSQAARKYVPRFRTEYLDFSSKRSVQWYARVARISPRGVLGDPSKASLEKGQRMWELMIHHLVQLVEDIKRLSLDEIYERRY